MKKGKKIALIIIASLLCLLLIGSGILLFINSDSDKKPNEIKQIEFNEERIVSDIPTYDSNKTLILKYLPIDKKTIKEMSIILYEDGVVSKTSTYEDGTLLHIYYKISDKDVAEINKRLSSVTNTDIKEKCDFGYTYSVTIVSDDITYTSCNSCNLDVYEFYRYFKSILDNSSEQDVTS